MRGTIRMCDLQPGQSGVVVSLDNTNAITHRLLDLGLIEGRRVACLGRALWKDPAAYEICGAVVALRRDVCRGVTLMEIQP